MDTLIIGGKTYTGVTGIKATDSSDVVQTFTKGGGGGLEYEEGTWTPAEDVARPTISFSKTHDTLPIHIMMYDATGTYSDVTYSNYYFVFELYSDFGKVPIYPSTNVFYYGQSAWAYRGTSTTAISIAAGSTLTYPSTYTGDNSTQYPRYWATEGSFRPYTDSPSRYWRAGRIYKWIAVWAPTT